MSLLLTVLHHYFWVSRVIASRLLASSSLSKEVEFEAMDSEARNKIISSHGPLISSSMSSVFGSNSKQSKGTFSVEDSGPPSPTSGPVMNFGDVAPGIYRSSFPMSGNFEHLRSLGLKTILYVSCIRYLEILHWY